MLESLLNDTIGKKVEIVNAGQTYSNYNDWVYTVAPDYHEVWTNTDRGINGTQRLKDGAIGVIIAVNPHLDSLDGSILMLIEIDYNGKKGYHIVNTNAVKPYMTKDEYRAHKAKRAVEKSDHELQLLAILVDKYPNEAKELIGV